LVRCVNSDGSMAGVIPVKEALKLAQDQGFDLVEVSPNANPPVCRIMDFGKFRYDESIREKQARKKGHKHALKEIKFHTNVGEHDYDYKMTHIREFLAAGHKVKVSLQFRGRENVHRELGFALIKRVLKEAGDVSTVEMDPKLMGRTLMAIVTPKAGKGRAAGDLHAPAPAAKPDPAPVASVAATVPVAPPATAPENPAP
jgi:translation initiation factor IF-3